MTRAEIVADLKNLIGPAVEVDDSGLAAWVNEAYLYIVAEITQANPDFFAKDATTTTLAGQRQYDLPSDFEKVLMINLQQNGVWSRPRPLPEVDKIPVYEDPAETNGFTLSNPAYFVYSDQIGLLPIPTDSAGIFKLWYVYTPSELTADSSVPAIPAKYHPLIKHGAYANYLDQDDQHGDADRVRQRFERRVEQVVEAMTQSQVEEPKFVQITNGYDLYYDDDYAL